MNQSINQSIISYIQSANQLHTIIHMLLFEFPESSVQKFQVLTIVSFTHLLAQFYCFMWELIKLPYKTEGHSLIKTSLTVEANCSLSPGYSWSTCHKLRRGTVGYKELRSDPQYAGQVAHQLWNVKGKAAALSTFVASDASWY